MPVRSRFLHEAAQALSRSVVRAYPQAWRDRYEIEVLALMDDVPTRPRDVLDLARGLVVERARSLFEPADRPLLTTTLVALGVYARALAVLSVPIVTGWAARLYLGPLPRMAGAGASMLELVILLSWAMRANAAYQKHSTKHSVWNPQQPVFSKQAGRVWLGGLLTATLLMAWDVRARPAMLLFVHVVANHLARQSGPWHEALSEALHRLRSAKHEMKWALMELDRCQRLVTGGVAAPIEEARQAVARIERRRAEAMGALYGLGYRATLHRPPDSV